MFDELVEFLKQHYQRVEVYRNEIGENVVWVTNSNGVTLGVVVWRIYEPQLNTT